MFQATIAHRHAMQYTTTTQKTFDTTGALPLKIPLMRMTR